MQSNLIEKARAPFEPNQKIEVTPPVGHAPANGSEDPNIPTVILPDYLEYLFAVRLDQCLPDSVIRIERRH